MQVNTTLGKYRIWDTNLSLPSLPPLTPPQFLAGAPCLGIDSVLGNRVILLRSGRTFYSAPFPARQAILAGVIGEGCRRQTKGHSSLAAFLGSGWGRGGVPDVTAWQLWKKVNKAAEEKEKFQECSLYFELINSLLSNVGGTKQPWDNSIAKTRERKKWREVGLAAVSLTLPSSLARAQQPCSSVESSAARGCWEGGGSPRLLATMLTVSSSSSAMERCWSITSRSFLGYRVCFWATQQSGLSRAREI